ncbi:transcription elongation factor 1, partial [Paraphysoderma sedebokerense]
MGKRKSKRKPQAKKKLTLDIVFDCMFCNHERVVEVKMEREHNIGSLRCRICNETFQTPIHALSEPIDVYSDWLDSCEAA